jgi:hypothetical protein
MRTILTYCNRLQSEEDGGFENVGRGSTVATAVSSTININDSTISIVPINHDQSNKVCFDSNIDATIGYTEFLTEHDSIGER